METQTITPEAPAFTETIITVTDANITAAGFAGMRTAVAQSATTGIHIGNFIASS